LLDIISKNISQSLAERNIILNTVVTPFIYYTCPAGKRAKIKGWIRCVDRGGATIARFEAAGIRLFAWNTAASQATVANTYEDRPESLTTSAGGKIANIDLVLEAGEDIRATQNAFTNAQFKINVTVKELPI